MRRILLSLLGLVLLLAVLGGAVVAFVPRNGQVLPDMERLRLLETAGLPIDFPVHPEARRMSQPAQGGISYAIRESVPVVLQWQNWSLQNTGYAVYADPIDGVNEELPRWLHFRSDAGAQGSILVRRVGRGLIRSTEVKILSRADPRLAPPPLPAGVIRP